MTERKKKKKNPGSAIEALKGAAAIPKKVSFEDPEEVVRTAIEARELLEPGSNLLGASQEELMEEDLAARQLVRMADDALHDPSDKLQQKIVDGIRWLMNHRQMRQSDLARAASLSPVVVNRILKGHRGLSFAQLQAIADALKVEPQILVSGELMDWHKEEMQAVSRAIEKIRTDPRQLHENNGATRLQSLSKFVAENEHRLTPDELEALVALSVGFVQRSFDPGEKFWLDMVRSLRDANPWPPRASEQN